MITEMFRVRPSERSRWQTSNPSTLGIMTSSRMRSGFWSYAAWRACSPSKAVTTSKPSRRRLTSTKRTMSSSSSATRIRSVGSLTAHPLQSVQALPHLPCGGQRVLAVEDGAAGDEYLCPCSYSLVDGPEVHPTVHLYIGTLTRSGEQLPGQLDLRHHFVQEGLPSETGP